MDENGNVLDPETGEIIVVAPGTETDPGTTGSGDADPGASAAPPDTSTETKPETEPQTPVAPPAEPEPPASQPEPEPAPETPAEPATEEPGFAIIDPAPEG